MKIERRSSGLKRARAVGVGIAALTVLSGVGFAWWSGQQSSRQAVLAAKTETANLHPTANVPREPAEEPMKVTVDSVTSPVSQESTATLTIKTTPGAKCTIEVAYDGVPSDDSGLSPATVDTTGTASWTWTVDESTPVGTWPAEVSCNRDGKSASVHADVEVTPPPAH